MLIISQVLVWVVLGFVIVGMIALARQIGVLHERIAPVGALAFGNGPQPGDAAPVLTSRTLSELPVAIGVSRAAERMQLLFFVSPTCPVCKQLMPTARSFTRAENIDLLLVGDGDEDAYRGLVAGFGMSDDEMVVDGRIGRAFFVGKLPYAVLLAPNGTIISQGLVNTREHLESLVAVRDTGFASVQDFLRAQRLKDAAVSQESNPNV
jgi:methylamine dehydrogenase accessory protein MauD